MIEMLKQTVVEAPAYYVGYGGLLIGLVFGFIVYRTNFCTMGSISDIVSFGDFRRMRAWLLAAATGIVGVLAIQQLGIADMNDAMYRTPNFNWMANIIGGLLFGFGMVFSGGCISRNLVRAGGGDLRSLVVLLITGIFGYMTIGGIFAPLRISIFGPTTIDLAEKGADSQGVGAVISLLSGIDQGTAHSIAAVVILAAILIYCFKDREFRTSPIHIIAGVGIGLCVIAGWVLTGLAADEFADQAVPLASLTYVRPTGDTLEYLMRFTALGYPGFGIMSVAGALLGGFVGALSMGRLHLTTFADKKDSIRNMFGAALMGTGGVLALGCTVGQALTGVSTLAVGSMITFAAIVAGGFAGVNYMHHLIMSEAAE